MKSIKYTMMTEVNNGTEKELNIVQTFNDCEIQCSEATFEPNYAIAEKEAYGEITVEDIKDEKIIAPRNIMAEEYITIGDVLYLATENIPNGEPIIVGQNAVITTIEAQLHELKGE